MLCFFEERSIYVTQVVQIMDKKGKFFVVFFLPGQKYGTSSSFALSYYISFSTDELLLNNWGQTSVNGKSV